MSSPSRSAPSISGPELVIGLPRPALVALVGASGSGKSTFAARHFGPDEVLSSDALRAAISGSEADQGATGTAFSILHRSLLRRLGEGRLVVVDATNVQLHARGSLLRRAHLAGVPAIALVLDVPDAVALARNRARPNRVVDETVVLRQLRDLRRSAAPGRLEREGFDRVIRLEGPEAIDAVRFEPVRHAAGVG